MKQIATILSIVSLALCGVLFYLFSHHTEQLKTISAIEQKKTAPDHFRIAYFDLDTLQANYTYFKDAMTKLKAQENDMNLQLSRLSKDYQKKLDGWRQKGNTMTQAETDQAQQEYASDQQNFQSQKQQLESNLYKSSEDYKSLIRKKVEEYLKKFNSRGDYSFIFAYEAGSFMYNKDTIYNITSALVDGLNAEYAAEQKKK